MLQSIFIISRRILRDAVRNRLLLIGLIFTLIISSFAAMAAAVSMGEHTRLVVDVGLSATSFFGTLAGIALAVGSVGMALRNKGLYPMLVRPISRFELLTGIFLGTMADDRRHRHNLLIEHRRCRKSTRQYTSTEAFWLCIYIDPH